MVKSKLNISQSVANIKTVASREPPKIANEQKNLAFRASIKAEVRKAGLLVIHISGADKCGLRLLCSRKSTNMLILQTRLHITSSLKSETSSNITVLSVITV